MNDLGKVGERVRIGMNLMLERLVEKNAQLEGVVPDIQAAFEILQECYRDGGKALICGNGGSASDSEHIVGELMKNYRVQRPIPQGFRQQLLERFPENGAYLADYLQGALPAISLVSQTAFLTAYSNDVAADMAFAQQVYGYGAPGDVLVAISTSGESKNVLFALQVAQARGLRTIGLTGRNGGAMKEICDIAIAVPASETGEVQELHMAVYHALCGMLEEAFFVR